MNYQLVHLTYINNITDAAKILEPSEDMVLEYVREGENITLRCVGVGHPPPLVQWSKLNGSLSDRVSSTNMSLSTNEGNVTRVTVDLIFVGAYRQNTGVYECLVSNILNNISRNISVIVQCMLCNIHIINIAIIICSMYILTCMYTCVCRIKCMADTM